MTWSGIPSMLMENALAVFGSDAIFKPRSGGSFPVRVIFSREGMMAETHTGMKIQTESISLALKISDLPQAPMKDDVFLLGEESFRVKSMTKDGRGGAMVTLYE